jgi:cytochrome c553
MGHIASRMNAQDVSAVSYWLAAQPLPKHTKPLAHLPELSAGVKQLTCGSASTVQPVPVNMAFTVTPLATKGAYLARVGNCQTCHTAPGGAPYAGGRAIETSFGTAFSRNLTSDQATGLGQWNADDFWQALHHGKSRDGRTLSPAFPYTEYTRVTRADSDALFAFFQSLPATAALNQPHKMRWPFGTQAALQVWRTLFFRPQTYVIKNRCS